ncbi:hypothetical protein PTKU46_31650 [Paraburkholderia terrae]|nr:hypothetical protein PTKU15_32910 [Paraburkholderia terrae]
MLKCPLLKIPPNMVDRAEQHRAAHGGRPCSTRINAKHDILPHDRRAAAPPVRADIRPAA